MCFIESPDGMVFDTDIKIKERQTAAKYKGFSLKFFSHLHTAKIPMQIDVGFSDKIVPSPTDIQYPTLLQLPSPNLRGYNPETSIAEKLHAILTLGLTNTRMKDFYDIWTLIQKSQINQKKFGAVAREIFVHRNTPIQSKPQAFTKRFYTNPKTLEQWNSFTKSINQKSISLEELILSLKEFFDPFLNSKTDEP